MDGKITRERVIHRPCVSVRLNVQAQDREISTTMTSQDNDCICCVLQLQPRIRDKAGQTLLGRVTPHDVLVLYSSGSQSSMAITRAERGSYGDRLDSVVVSSRSGSAWSPDFSNIGSSLSADDSLSTSTSIADDDGFASVCDNGDKQLMKLHENHEETTARLTIPTVSYTHLTLPTNREV